MRGCATHDTTAGDEEDHEAKAGDPPAPLGEGPSGHCSTNQRGCPGQQGEGPWQQGLPPVKHAEHRVGGLVLHEQEMLRAQGLSEIDGIAGPDDLVDHQESHRRQAEATRFGRADQERRHGREQDGLEPDGGLDRIAAPVEQEIGQEQKQPTRRPDPAKRGEAACPAGHLPEAESRAGTACVAIWQTTLPFLAAKTALSARGCRCARTPI